MQQTRISFHLGVLCTDGDQLSRSLLRNANLLAEQGIIVPSPNRYRPLIHEVVEKLGGAPASQVTQDVLFEHITETEDAERLVLSNQYFLSNHPGAFKNGQLYPSSGERSVALRNLFPENPVEFFIAVRNPATWIPALHSGRSEVPFPQFVARVDPDMTVWSDVIRDIREANPDVPITVWSNEDTPLIWPEVMHEITGVDPQVQLLGDYTILKKIMAKEGFKRLSDYLTAHPPENEIKRRRILTAFLDKYALEKEVEEEIDLPGWTPDLIEHLSTTYDDDLIEISRLPGVTLLTA